MEEKKTKGGRGKAVLLCLACFLLGGALALGLVWKTLGEDGRTLVLANRLIQTGFVGEFDREQTKQAALAAMVESLGDRWSYYLTPEQAQQTRQTRENAYVGIGVTITQEETQAGLEILSVTPGSPAEEGGLAPGEIILEVEGTAITQENREEAVAAISGEAGTTVTLAIQGLDGARRTVTLERRQVQTLSAVATMLDGQVGYVDILNFYSGTAGLVKEGVAQLQEQGATALVFDVRSNPGGYVTEMTEILDFLLPEGEIFRSQGTRGEEEVYTSDAACVSLPMAVVVNQDSYSAAEFFAAQLRESAGAAVVGEVTSGKGYSQMLFSLPDGSAIGLSTARYYTGGGVSLIGTGLEPDRKVSLSQADQEAYLQGKLSPEEDEQLAAALAALEG